MILIAAVSAFLAWFLSRQLVFLAYRACFRCHRTTYQETQQPAGGYLQSNCSPLPDVEPDTGCFGERHESTGRSAPSFVAATQRADSDPQNPGMQAYSFRLSRGVANCGGTTCR